MHFDLFLGECEQHQRRFNSAKELLIWFRKYQRIERMDLFKIRKLPKVSPGYPKGAVRYQVIKTTRVAGIYREKVHVNSFLVIKWDK